MKDLNILIVEDEEYAKELLKTILSESFTNIFTASNGLKALDIVKNNKIDVIVTDIEMPKMNGIEMAKEIKKTNPFIHIIASTAYDNQDLLKELINLNFDGYFQKPLNVEEIVDKLNQIASSKKFNFYKSEYTEPLTKCKNRKFLIMNLKIL